MPRLGAPLPDFIGGGQHAIHRARRAEVRLFVQQGGVDFGGRLIDKPLAVQHVEDGVPFGGDQRPWRAARTVGIGVRAGCRRR